MPFTIFKTTVLVLSMLVIAGCPSTPQVKEEAPAAPRNLLGTTDELQLVTELLANLNSEHGTENILVVLAIDNTLLADAEGDHCGDGSHDRVKPQLVQPDTANQVQRMQAMGSRVIGMSGHSPECGAFVISELAHYEISFADSAWPVGALTASEFTPSGVDQAVGYQDGVFLSSGQDSGEMLKALLEQSKLPLPSLIVVVDYQQKELSEVMKAFAFSNTRVHAWRYTRIDTAHNYL